eukprot:373773-Rhodomonas_salina.1
MPATSDRRQHRPRWRMVRMSSSGAGGSPAPRPSSTRHRRRQRASLASQSIITTVRSGIDDGLDLGLADGRAIGLARTGDAAWVIGVDADEWVSTFESGA